jgi:hypothetical protein
LGGEGRQCSWSHPPSVCLFELRRCASSSVGYCARGNPCERAHERRKYSKRRSTAKPFHRGDTHTRQRWNVMPAQVPPVPVWYGTHQSTGKRTRKSSTLSISCAPPTRVFTPASALISRSDKVGGKSVPWRPICHFQQGANYLMYGGSAVRRI